MWNMKKKNFQNSQGWRLNTQPDTSLSNEGHAFSQVKGRDSDMSCVSFWKVTSNKYNSTVSSWMVGMNVKEVKQGPKRYSFTLSVEITHAERRKNGCHSLFHVLFLSLFQCVFMFLMRKTDLHVNIFHGADYRDVSKSYRFDSAVLSVFFW